MSEPHDSWLPHHNDFTQWAEQLGHDYDPTARDALDTPLLELGIETSERQLDNLYALRSLVEEELIVAGARITDVTSFHQSFTNDILAPRYMAWAACVLQRSLHDENWSPPPVWERDNEWRDESLEFIIGIDFEDETWDQEDNDQY